IRDRTVTGVQTCALPISVAGFAVAGGGDYVWHTVFGIEQNIDILFSPTHVGLIAAMLVIVTTPVRAMWADPSVAADARLRRLARSEERRVGKDGRCGGGR